MVRAPDSKSGCWGFDSLLACQFWVVLVLEVEKLSTLKKGNLLSNGMEYVQGSRKELKKVTWPGRKEVTAVTTVVIVLTFVAGFYLAIVDWFLSQIVKYLIG